MKHFVLNSWLIEIIAALFILLFVYTGISKLLEVDRFRAALIHSPLPMTNATLLSWLLPVAELLTALILFLPYTRKAGLIISFGLMLIFTGYIAYMILYTPHLPCSCGGVLKQMTWKQHLGFNILFTMLSAFGICLYQKNKRFIAINRNSRTPV